MAKKLVDSQGRTRYRFTFGPWNIHEGADPFGPPVRTSFSFNQKLAMYRELGFEGVQFHDDDAVPHYGNNDGIINENNETIPWDWDSDDDGVMVLPAARAVEMPPSLASAMTCSMVV